MKTKIKRKIPYKNGKGMYLKPYKGQGMYLKPYKGKGYFKVYNKNGQIKKRCKKRTQKRRRYT